MIIIIMIIDNINRFLAASFCGRTQPQQRRHSSSLLALCVCNVVFNNIYGHLKCTFHVPATHDCYYFISFSQTRTLATTTIEEKIILLVRIRVEIVLLALSHSLCFAPAMVCMAQSETSTHTYKPITS